MSTQAKVSNEERAAMQIGDLSDFDGMGQAIKARLAMSPHRIAFKDLDGGAQYTCAEIERKVDALCAAFAKEGLAKGSSIVTNLENGQNLIVLILASLVFGVRLAVIESQTPPARLKYFIDLVTPQLAFMTDASLGFLPAGLRNRDVAQLVETGDRQVPSFVPATIGEDDGIVIFSSGSTGEPKGVVHSHGNIAAELDAMIEGYDVGEGMNHLVVLPFAHVSGLYRGLLMPFMSGGSIHLRRGLEPQSFWNDTIQHEIGFVQLVPTHIAILNRAGAEPAAKPQRLRFIGTASGYLPPREQLSFEERFGVPLLQGYGMTETTCGIVLNSRDPAIRRPGVAGQPLKCNEIRIVDTAGVEVEPEEVGEVYVRGKNIARRFLGYDGPDFDDGWLKTGDMGRFDPHGNLVLVGRRANIISRGAYKIHALEIEEALAALPSVTEAAVVGVPHPVLGQDIIAFVVTDVADTVQLIGALRDKISSFKIPSRIIAVAKLPRNKVGKIARDDLLKIADGGKSGNSDIDEKKTLVRIIEMITGIFALQPNTITSETIREDIAKWDSLGHLQVVVAIENEFGIKISDESASAAQGVADLVKLVNYASRSEIRTV